MIFRKWKASTEEAKKKLDAVREADFLAHLKQMKTAQGELAEELTKTVSAIDKTLERDQQELTLTRERIKAQIELNRQRALEGKSGEEAERISRVYDSQLNAIDRQASDSQIALQIEAAQAARDKVREAIADSEDRDSDLQRTQEIEDAKADIAIEVEERKQERIKAIRAAAERQEEMRSLAAQHASLVAEGGDAASRLADAKQQVATAWGWYSDRDSLRAQIAEWEDDAAARKQYAKDYQSLVHGRNAERYSEALYLQRADTTRSWRSAWASGGARS